MRGKSDGELQKAAAARADVGVHFFLEYNEQVGRLRDARVLSPGRRIRGES